VCLAIDNVDNKNMTAAEWEWIQQRGGDASTHGMCVFTPAGDVLARFGGYQALHVLDQLHQALAAFGHHADTETSIADSPTSDEDMLRPPPPGASVLFASWMVTGSYGPPQSSSTTGNGVHDGAFLRAVGFDRLWLLQEERAALVEGNFPSSLARRIARHHLDYVLQGDHPVEEIVIEQGRIEGSFRSDDGSGRAARVHGRVQVSDGRLTALDLLVEGHGQRVADCGFSACLTVVPEGVQVPVALLFSLADEADPLAHTTPHRARAHNYLVR